MSKCITHRNIQISGYFTTYSILKFQFCIFLKDLTKLEWDYFNPVFVLLYSFQWIINPFNEIHLSLAYKWHRTFYAHSPINLILHNPFSWPVEIHVMPTEIHYVNRSSWIKSIVYQNIITLHWCNTSLIDWVVFKLDKLEVTNLYITTKNIFYRLRPWVFPLYLLWILHFYSIMLPTQNVILIFV